MILSWLIANKGVRINIFSTSFLVFSGQTSGLLVIIRTERQIYFHWLRLTFGQERYNSRCKEIPNPLK